MWVTLINVVWPAAKTQEAVCLAIAYCDSRKLDPMKKPVNIIPAWSSELNAEVEIPLPSITDVRITATRTGVYAGKDRMKFGDEIEREFFIVQDNQTIKKTFKFPEWAELTVYKIVQGERCEFVGPKVYWLEAYATAGRASTYPNEMWEKRANGMLDKCAEAGALRSAFPEELGGQMTAEEMYGRVINYVPPAQLPPPPVDGEVRPAQPRTSEFSRPADAAKGGRKPKKATQPKKKAKKETPAADVDVKAMLRRSRKALRRCKTVGKVGDLTAELEKVMKPGPELDAWHKDAKARTETIIGGKPK
jgi:phage recombination protein Bet